MVVDDQGVTKVTNSPQTGMFAVCPVRVWKLVPQNLVVTVGLLFWVQVAMPPANHGKRHIFF